jgi:hypothetical protein
MLEIAAATFLVGIGVGVVNAGFLVTAQNAVAHRIVGSTTAFVFFWRAIGMTFGATLFGLCIVHGLPAAASDGTLDHRLGAAGRLELAQAIHLAFGIALALSVVVVLVALTGLEEAPLRTSVVEERAEERLT